MRGACVNHPDRPGAWLKPDGTWLCDDCHAVAESKKIEPMNFRRLHEDEDPELARAAQAFMAERAETLRIPYEALAAAVDGALAAGPGARTGVVIDLIAHAVLGLVDHGIITEGTGFYRTGRSNLHTLYRQLGDDPSKADEWVASFREPGLAAIAARALNRYAEIEAREVS